MELLSNKATSFQLKLMPGTESLNFNFEQHGGREPEWMWFIVTMDAALPAELLSILYFAQNSSISACRYTYFLFNKLHGAVLPSAGGRHSCSINFGMFFWLFSQKSQTQNVFFSFQWCWLTWVFTAFFFHFLLYFHMDCFIPEWLVKDAFDKVSISSVNVQAK